MWQNFIDSASDLANKFKFTIGRERAILLICMGIALLFWMFVKLSKQYQTDRIVNLQYQLPLGMQFREAPPSRIEATFSGSGWDLLMTFIFQREPVVTFDVPAVGRQEIQRPEIISKIEEQISIQVVDLNRNYLFLSLDSTAQKRVKVLLNADISFSPDFNYRDSIVLSPDSVTIYSSEALLEKISHLSTEKLTLKNLDQDIHRTLSIVNPGPEVLRLSEQSTDVFIAVEQFTEKSFTVPILMVGMKDSIAIVPSKAEVICMVGLSRYDDLDGSNFVIEANFENVINIKEQNTVPLALTSHPPWVRSVEFFPKAVEYLIIK